VAGHETTSGMLSFALYLLSQNEEFETKALAEVDKVIGRDLTSTIEWKHVAQLKYLDMIFKEALRLYPTAPGFYKMALRDCSYGKYTIKKGTAFVNLAWGLHRNPRCWPEPERFNPERFAPHVCTHFRIYAYC
jgi:cytochrome P450/NADPH-cytochrome P450 reductase